MAQTCQVCGKKILEGVDVHEKWIWNANADESVMGGKCGRCGRLCCADCYKNGACPSCRETLKQGGSQYF